MCPARLLFFDCNICLGLPLTLATNLKQCWRAVFPMLFGRNRPQIGDLPLMFGNQDIPATSNGAISFYSIHRPKCKGYRLFHLGNYPIDIFLCARVSRSYPYVVSSHTVLGAHSWVEANAYVVERCQVNSFRDTFLWREWLFGFLAGHKFQLYFR